MPDTSLIGLTLADRFRLTGVIGEGGMATVYRGLAGGDEVAIKIMNPELAKESRFVRRFRREAKAASILKNPNTVRILEFGVDQGYVFLAMELLKGFDLAMLLHREKKITEGRALRIVAQVCRALAAAHKQSIIHRDLKPDNIMLVKVPEGIAQPIPGLMQQDFVKVLDFGIAKILDDDGEKAPVDSRAEPMTQEKSMLTRVGTIVGTPAYMAPEQGRAEPVDARTDVYACGVLLYELITGRVPFLGETPMQVVMRHVNEAPRPPSDFGKIHPEVEKLILRALAKYPVQRQQSAEEMEMEVLRVLAIVEPASAKPEVEPNRTLVIETHPADAGMAFPTLNIEVPDDIFPSSFGKEMEASSSAQPATRRVETPTTGAKGPAIPVVRPGQGRAVSLSQTMQSLAHEETSLNAPRPNVSDDDEEAATMVKPPPDADNQRLSRAAEMEKALKGGIDVPTVAGPESVEPTLVTSPQDAPKPVGEPAKPAPHPHERTAVSEPEAPAVPKPKPAPAVVTEAPAKAATPSAKQNLALAETLRVDAEELAIAQQAIAAAAAEKEDRPVRRPTSELVPITLQEEEEVSPPKEDLSKPQAEQAAVWTPSPQKRLSGGMALFLGIAIGAAIVVVGLGLLFLLRNNG